MKEKFIRMNLYLGLSGLFVAAILLIFKVPLMITWFYCFAWWSFILIVDSINFRRTKSSLLYKSGKDFLFMAFLSVFVWLVFELFNLRLQNWSYHDLPENWPIRWLGYFIAFASVVPAMKELQLFFMSILKDKGPAFFRLKVTPAVVRLCVFLGATLAVLALAWPRIFFPSAWLCFIFLLEPINLRLGVDTLLKDFERKNWNRFWSWVLAGFFAGFLWEFWNFWAGSHWEYSLPYLNFYKIFQMPVFGYTGFLPFALQVFAFYQIISYLNKKLRGKILLRILLCTSLFLFYAGCFYLIDVFSLKH